MPTPDNDSQVRKPTGQRVPLRLRPDLAWIEIERPLGSRWRVRDPLSLAYHEFGSDERFLLQQFDGRRSLAEIREAYDRQFAPQRIRPQRLAQFASQAHSSGLLLSSGPQQAQRLLEREQRGRGLKIWSRATSLLFCKLPGFDPTRLLDRLVPWLSWCFSPLAMIGVILAGILLALLMIGRAAEVAARLPSSEQFLQAGNVVLLVLAFAVVKIIHELAHGIACRRVGAQCREMGVMLIALMPCLYCEVTDTWMIANRWKRILVSAAGMYAELAVGIVCGYLWLMASDGVVASVLLNVMIACTVSTLLFNLNPLLKLDGYFILSDVVGVPNLHQRSREALLAPAKSWFMNARAANVVSDWRLVIYALLSLAYRAMVIVLIAWAAYSVLAANHLRPVADALVVLTVAGLLTAPLRFVGSIAGSPLLRRSIRWGRTVAGAAAVALVVWALLLVPLPHTVTAPAVFEVRNASPVSATVSGKLVQVVREGDIVKAGQQIARLQNDNLHRQYVRLSGQLQRSRQKAQDLRRRATLDPKLLGQIPTAQAAAEALAKDLAKLTEQARRLVIRAPHAGTVIGVTRQQPREIDPSDPLSTWSGRLVDPENAGCWVEPGDQLCLVAPDPAAVKATLMVRQEDTLGVQTGLQTRILPYHASSNPDDQTLCAPVSEVASVQSSRLGETLRHHPDLLRARHDAAETLGPMLLATVELPGNRQVIRHASHGRCKIELPAEPIGLALLRWWRQTFTLPL